MHRLLNALRQVEEYSQEAQQAFCNAINERQALRSENKALLEQINSLKKNVELANWLNKSLKNQITTKNDYIEIQREGLLILENKVKLAEDGQAQLLKYFKEGLIKFGQEEEEGQEEKEKGEEEADDNDIVVTADITIRHVRSPQSTSEK